MRPVHYQNEQGEQQEIDTEIRNGRVEGAPYKARLLDNAIGYRYESRRGGWMQIELHTLDGETVKAPKPRIEDDTAYWDAIAPDVSMYFKALPTHPEIFKTYASGTHTTVWKVTQSADFPGRFDSNTRGKDANLDNLEILTTYEDGTFTETFTGRVSRIPEGEKRRRKKQWFTDPAYPVTVDAAITENVATGADDAVNITGTAPNFDTTGPGITMKVSTSNRYFGGFRFQSLDIPAGAVISSALLTVNLADMTGPPPGAGSGVVPHAKFYGADVDDLAAWADPGNLPGAILKTTASASFDPTTLGVKVLDVTAIVAEIVARAGWATGNDMGFVGFGQGEQTTFSSIVLEAFDNPGSDEAQLDITYTEAEVEPEPVPYNHGATSMQRRFTLTPDAIDLLEPPPRPTVEVESRNPTLVFSASARLARAASLKTPHTPLHLSTAGRFGVGWCQALHSSMVFGLRIYPVRRTAHEVASLLRLENIARNLSEANRSEAALAQALQTYVQRMEEQADEVAVMALI